MQYIKGCNIGGSTQNVRTFYLELPRAAGPFWGFCLGGPCPALLGRAGRVTLDPERGLQAPGDKPRSQIENLFQFGDPEKAEGAVLVKLKISFNLGGQPGKLRGFFNLQS